MTVEISPSNFDGRLISFPFDQSPDEIPSKQQIGSKAHNLIRMASAGLPVPPGFVIGTQFCRDYLKFGRGVIDQLSTEINHELQRLGEQTGRFFGDPRRPLLVSVRSGAAVSMPGMMETVLNIGLNRSTAKGLIRLTGNPRLAADCRIRLVSQYGEVVEGISPEVFAEQRKNYLGSKVVSSIDELDTASLNQLADIFEDLFSTKSGNRLPSNPFIQIERAIAAVFDSWRSKRATTYRRMHSIPDEIGTAVIVQSMVFGNQGPNSGSGVGFTRNPADGTNELYVDYLTNAQGEDVVAGRRVAMGLEELARRAPQAFQSLLAARDILEREFSDMQDFEFTVENGNILLLQSRSGKRTPLAALRIACDLVAEGLITPAVARKQLQGVDLESIEEVRLASENEKAALQGTPAGSGVAIGAAVFDPARISTIRESGNSVVLIRTNAETSDIEALSHATALVSCQGARTSHAAVVARQMGKPCIVGCSDLAIHSDGRNALFGDHSVSEGQMLSVDGENGRVYLGTLKIIKNRPTQLLQTVQSWNE